MERTTLEMLIYTIALAACTMLLGPVAGLGLLYAVVALVLNLGFIWMTLRLYQLAKRDEAGEKAAMKIFHFSITYLTLLFVAMAVDVLVANLVSSH